MRRIVAIGDQEKVGELRDNLSCYLTAFAYPWLTLCEFYSKPTERIYLTTDQREELKNVLEEALRYLVKRLYRKPSERQLTIHPGRFERIEVDDQTYLVNYRTSESGWLMFALYTFQKSVTRKPDVLIRLAPISPGQE